jgi:hypothetical protein
MSTGELKKNQNGQKYHKESCVVEGEVALSVAGFSSHTTNKQRLPDITLKGGG